MAKGLSEPGELAGPARNRGGTAVLIIVPEMLASRGFLLCKGVSKVKKITVSDQTLRLNPSLGFRDKLELAR
ncbi:MAG: hypothetical protein J5827_05520, partial [Oscillospiraceae bacterium]|nr:hypothetical protein [Oscillospiraceae bacterium]